MGFNIVFAAGRGVAGKHEKQLAPSALFVSSFFRLGFSCLRITSGITGTCLDLF